jgi:dTDP-4-amino-4,6-dideoxygalactose transaminase
VKLPFPEPIHVTRPLLPPLDRVSARLAQVWDSKWLTNGGPQHEALEAALRRRLQVEHLSLFNNGTIALVAAVKALDLSGEVITTPFTFPATPHALSWSGITPVFADLDPERLTLAPAAVEASITSRTTAILGVHVYGVPCDVEALGAIARRHRLALVYDAAHAFGVRVNGTPIGCYGDATMFSFHATKLFHTAEGGAIVSRSEELRHRIERLKNFGIADQETVETVGLNGKMSELQAVLGLEVLECMDEELARRREVIATYRRVLADVRGVTFVPEPPGVESSRQYCVIRIDPAEFGCSRDEVHEALKRNNVFTRKYFYPLCSDYASYRGLPSAAPARLPVARRAVTEVLCLPLYGTLDLTTVQTIGELIAAEQRIATR